MKNIKYLAFVVLSIFVIDESSAQNQVFVCDTNQIIISNAICEEPGNDFLLFTLEVTTPNSNSGNSLTISQLPAGTTYTNTNNNSTSTGTSFNFGRTNLVYEVRVPTTDCDPISFEYDLQDGPASCQNQTVTVSAFITPIPTMGQWGIIVLSLLTLSIGVIALKNKGLIFAGK